MYYNVTCDGVRFRDLKDIIEVNDSLWNGIIVIINWICQFSIVVQNKPKYVVAVVVRQTFQEKKITEKYHK